MANYGRKFILSPRIYHINSNLWCKGIFDHINHFKSIKIVLKNCWGNFCFFKSLNLGNYAAWVHKKGLEKSSEQHKGFLWEPAYKNASREVRLQNIQDLFFSRHFCMLFLTEILCTVQHISLSPPVLSNTRCSGVSNFELQLWLIKGGFNLWKMLCSP